MKLTNPIMNKEPLTIEYCLMKMENSISFNRKEYWREQLENVIKFERSVSLDKQLRELIKKESEYCNIEYPDNTLPLTLMRIQNQKETVINLIEEI